MPGSSVAGVRRRRLLVCAAVVSGTASLAGGVLPAAASTGTASAVSVSARSLAPARVSAALTVGSAGVRGVTVRSTGSEVAAGTDRVSVTDVAAATGVHRKGSSGHARTAGSSAVDVSAGSGASTSGTDPVTGSGTAADTGSGPGSDPGTAVSGSTDPVTDPGATPGVSGGVAGGGVDAPTGLSTGANLTADDGLIGPGILPWIAVFLLVPVFLGAVRAYRHSPQRAAARTRRGTGTGSGTPASATVPVTGLDPGTSASTASVAPVPGPIRGLGAPAAPLELGESRNSGSIPAQLAPQPVLETVPRAAAVPASAVVSGQVSAGAPTEPLGLLAPGVTPSAGWPHPDDDR